MADPTVHEITMVRTDIVRVEIRDDPVRKGPLVGPGTAETGTAYNSMIQRTNPETASLEWCYVVGENKDYLDFLEPAATSFDDFLDRDAADVAGDWSLTGSGLTVTAVYRKSYAYDAGKMRGSGGGEGHRVSMKHFMFLQLSGDLSNGSYTLNFPAGTGLASVPFVFNDKQTRCSALHVNQHGMRAGDYKLGYYSVWIPGAPNEGAITLPSGSSPPTFHVLDSGDNIVYTNSSSLRVAATEADASELVRVPALEEVTITAVDTGTNIVTTNLAHGYGNPSSSSNAVRVRLLSGVTVGGLSAVTNYWVRSPTTTTLAFYPTAADAFASTNIIDLTSSGTGTVFKTDHTTSAGLHRKATTNTAGLHATNITKATSGVVTYTGSAYTPSNGDIVCFRGISDVNSNPIGTLELVMARIDNVDTGAGTFVIDVDTTNMTTYVPGQYITEHDGQIYKTHLTSRCGTNVYGLDFSAFTSEGTYRLYLPGVGVSDPFDIYERAWYDYAKMCCAGVYHHRMGIELDGRFGYTRPICIKDGVNGVHIRKSDLPAIWSSEAGTLASANTLTSAAGDDSAWVSATRASGIYGGHMDAGDWDTFILAHFQFYYELIDMGWDYANETARGYRFGVPLSSETLDPVLFAGTDVFNDAWHEAVWGIDFYRRLQNPDGSVGGGLGHCRGGVGEIGSGPSYLLVPNAAGIHAYIYAPDHCSNFIYALGAGKVAATARDMGLTTLADTFQQSAIDAWDWAEPMFQNASGEIDAYYLTTLNIKKRPKTDPVTISSINAGTDVATASAHGLSTGTKVGVDSVTFGGLSSNTDYWVRVPSSSTLTFHPSAADANANTNIIDLTGSGTGRVFRTLTDAEYTSGLATIASIIVNIRKAAAGMLLRLTGDAFYEDIVDGESGQSFQSWLGIGTWEYANAPTGADSAVQTTYLNQFDNEFSGPFTYSFGDNSYRNQGFSGVGSITFCSENRLVLIQNMLTGNTRGLEMMQAGAGFVLGANHMGLCLTTGMGGRTPTEMLHEDTKRRGMNPPPGITYYGWDPGFFASVANFSTDSPLNAIVENVTGDFEADFGSARLYEPYRGSLPKFEHLPENRFVIHVMEYTFHQTGGREWIRAQWLSSWDEVVEETPAIESTWSTRTRYTAVNM